MLAKKALAGTAGAPKLYVEDVMSCFLYTGNNNTAQTITNNIDLSTEGGLIWFKDRSNVNGHFLIDTVRGANSQLRTHSTAAETTSTNYISSFNNNGFTLGTNGNINGSETQVSWTFRKAKKFFDVVTYTGTGSARSVSHNLGSTPGCIIIKCTSNADSWIVYHRSTGTSKFLYLNTTDAEQTYSWISSVGSTSFTLNDDSSLYNTNGRTYVAYLFAHDAGGFGDAGSDSIIKCGSYTGTTGVDTVDLGWEPQWLLIKRSSSTSPWWLVDNMRGMSWGSNTIALSANTSGAENTDPFPNVRVRPTPTGFQLPSDGSEWDGDGSTYIYIAIRRGPMKTPTSGTSVFQPTVRTGTGTSNQSITGVSFPPDLAIVRNRPSNLASRFAVFDKLRGPTKYLDTAASDADLTGATSLTSFNQDGVTFGDAGVVNGNGDSYINWLMRRAPGFFDVVCYTGTGANTTVSHNLGVTPELIFVKRRNSTGNWIVYANNDPTDYLLLNLDSATADLDTVWNDTSPTSTNFTVGTVASVNASGGTYVAYLFASVSGVSKVGTYTGNGSSVTVTTGFQPRFVLVKRIDSAGNWIVGDSARGLVAGSDPYLLLNSSAAEDTDEDWVDVSSTGFTVNQTTASNANVNTGTYIYLAVS